MRSDAEVQPRKAKAKRIAPVRQLKSRTAARSQPAKSQLQSKPTGRKAKTGPKARNTDLGDDQGVDKQERCFTKWLSHALEPDTSIAIQAHTSEESPTTNHGLHDQQLQQVRLRARAYRLMTVPETRDCTRLIKEELDAGRIAGIRTDVSLHADVRIHNHCLECVTNYTPAWLRLGLEAVFGESLSCSDNDESFLSTFVKQRLMFDEDIAAAFKHDDQQGNLNRFTTMMMLSLVLFLDRAKSARVLDNDPSLFKKQGTIKSSMDMIHQFFDGVLGGGGDIAKQLRQIDYNVEHSQTALAEYSFGVSNLATDLKDGVRLCKLAEMLTNDSGPMNQVKCPANSPAVMKHNINLALDAFQKMGCNAKLCAKAEDIINGRSDRSLSLLWNIMMRCQILDMIDADALSTEIDNIRYWRRDSVSAGRRSSVTSDSGIVDTNLYMNSDKLQLLLLWCRGVCARYGVRVHNFTTSFSDGRVLCLLINHYHPELLSLDDVSGKPKKEKVDPALFDDESDAADSCAGGEQFLNYFIPMDSSIDEEEEDVAMDCKMKNFHVLQSRVMELGGIPNIITPRDMVTGAPDEKVVITYVTYLSSRLLDIRVQVEAALTISRQWKAYSAHVVLPRQNAAACCIQRAARTRFDFTPISQQIEKVAAAQLVQRMWRGFTTREQVLPMMRAQLVSVDLMQATFRAFMQRKAYKLVILAMHKLQSMCRGRAARQNFTQTTQAIRIVQRLCRGNQARAQVAALRLETQSVEAGTRRVYESQCAAAVTVQTAWKGYVGRKTFDTIKAVVRVQALARGGMIRLAARNASAAMQVEHAATEVSATAIQTQFRGWEARRAYRAQYTAAVAVQMAQRRRAACKALQTIKTVVRVQALWRGAMARQTMETVDIASTAIQAQFRGWSQNKTYTEMRGAVVVTQAAVRCWQARSVYESQCTAAANIQAAYRTSLLHASCMDDAVADPELVELELADSEPDADADVATIDLVEHTEAAVQIQRASRGWAGRQFVSHYRDIIVRVQVCL